MFRLHDYLGNKLDAVELNGFNSLSTGRLGSVFALLGGQDLDDMRSSKMYSKKENNVRCAAGYKRVHYYYRCALSVQKFYSHA